MKKSRKIISIFILLLLIGVTSTLMIRHKEQDKSDALKFYTSELEPVSVRAKTSGVMSSSEIYLTNPEIIALSKVIVKGKITKLLGKYNYHCTDVETGEDVVSTRYLYEFVLEEVLKGAPEDDMKISISKFIEEEKYTIGKEYIWCLQRMNGDYEGAYDCISYTQSLFTIDGDIMKRNGNESEQITIEQFKELIDVNEEDNSFRNDKNSAYNLLTNDIYDTLYEE